ncbi:PFGI-1 class ICE element type IV pilus protein PilL2 [Lelliottia wanjuensis]|uniref:Response regulator n=1 Tax=Lelliottia wanjuensis TaxID=3050585 RepID=A0AAP4FV57_9ENTR|nr:MULTISPECIES: response regulator [unclassified Lelliottia]MDK9361954.1 response regulator [Lelliottia sp. V106_12]MDK9584321.1 response regulator [Lelliottia sp. V86_10]MDK9617354.1 response regulator [Lelliottia sp. V106_9]
MKISLIPGVLLLAGCTARSAPPLPCPTPPAPALAERVHTARYTLVDISPAQTLRFPLRQIISKTLPPSGKHHRHLTREEALRGWLNGSGYGLCLPVTTSMRLFYGSPLPDAQRRMGPVRTEAALQTIAGSAWVMTTDEVSRTVCWQPAPAIRPLG